MPSTYTTNNGIELIATGEQSGTWGTTTNTNLELLDASLDGQVSITLSSAGSSGSPNTLPISNGSASNGRNRLVIFGDGGDLGATAYVQLTPNDAEKIIYVRNSLSGSRSILLFQGTYNASNDYEVPAGTTAVVFFDGAGSGAVAANVFNNAFFDSLRLGSVSVDKILDQDDMSGDDASALATQQSIKAYVDSQVGGSDTLTEVLANGNTTSGRNIQMTTTDELQFRDTALKISSSADGKLDIDADTEIEIVAPTLDIDASTAVTVDTTTMTVTGAVDVTGDLDVDNININGNTISSSDTNGNITLAPNGTGVVALSSTDLTFGDNDKAIFGAGSDLQIYHDGSNSYVKDAGTGDLFIQGSTNVQIEDATGANMIFATSGGSVKLFHNALPKLETTSTGIDVTGSISADGLTVDGNQNLNGDLKISDVAVFINMLETDTTDLNTRLRSANGDFYIETINDALSSASTRLNIDHSTGDISFYEDTGTTAKFFWDASAESLGIGTTSPTTLLELKSTTATAGLCITADNASNSDINLGDEDDVNIQRIRSDHTNNSLQFQTNNAERMRIDSSGNVGIGNSSPSYPLEVGDALGIYDDNTSAVLAANTGHDLELRARSSQNVRLVSGGTEAMRIDSSGNVGIGTSSPSYPLTVQATNPRLQLLASGTNTGTSGILFGDADTATRGQINYTHSDDELSFVVDAAERLRIDSSGINVTGTVTDDGATHDGDVTFTGANYNVVWDKSDDALEFPDNAKIVLGTGGDYAIYNDGATVEQLVFEEASGTSSGIFVFQGNLANAVGPTLRIEHSVTAGASGNFPAILDMETKDAGGNTVTAFQILSKLVDGTSGAATSEAVFYVKEDGNSAALEYMKLNGDAEQIDVSKNMVSTADITAVNFNTTSDASLKTNISTFANPLDTINSLRGVAFDWINSGKSEIGVIAQEVEKVLPDLVSTNKEGIKSVKYGNLIAVLIEAVKDQQSQINELKSKLS